MDNAQKAIMIGVGLFITIILITAVMAITGIGTGLLNSGQEKIAGLSSQLESQLTADFDNKSMSGSEVLAHCTKYYQTLEMEVVLDNSGTEYFVSNYATNGTEVTYNNNNITKVEMQTSGNTSKRIVTTGRYLSTLIIENDLVVGIKFTKQ